MLLQRRLMIFFRISVVVVAPAHTMDECWKFDVWLAVEILAIIFIAVHIAPTGMDGAIAGKIFPAFIANCIHCTMDLCAECAECNKYGTIIEKQIAWMCGINVEHMKGL